jgi:ornithine cyclodeaminase
MVKLIDRKHLKTLTKKVGIKPFFEQLIDRLEQDFSRWHEFHKSARHAIHYEHGVLELMPIADNHRYAYKYVNGHPGNTANDALCVVAIGMLVDVASGYPLMISEMTWLTAFRTAAAAALAAKHLATAQYDTMGIIGTGAQAEFLVLALTTVLPIKTVKYFDIDAKAMEKFKKNLAPYDLTLIACDNAKAVTENTPLLVTATAAKQKQALVQSDWIQPGTLILGMGGDCPGKTELPEDILPRCKVFVEYAEQTLAEGESQHLGREHIHAELWEIIAGEKKAHADDDDILLFDAVGFALEDFSVLNLVYDLAEKLNLGEMQDLIPQLDDPKNLFAALV